MAGLVPAIHVFQSATRQDVDARDKRGDDGAWMIPYNFISQISPMRSTPKL